MKKATTLLLVAGFVLLATPQVYAANGDSNIMHPIAVTADGSNGSGPTTSIGPIFTLGGDSGSGKIIASAPGNNPGGVITGKQQFVSTIQNASPVTYADLQGHFAAHAVARLTEAGILSAAANGQFQPNALISRADLKAWMEKAAGVTLQDTNPTAQTITRLEAAQWIAQAIPNLQIDTNGILSGFPYQDTQNITDAQREALTYLYQTNIMIGEGQGHFAPNAALTRGEAAALLDKLVESAFQTGSPVTYDSISGTVPDAVNALINKNHGQAGLYTTVDSGVRYVVLAGGTVPTGGYSVLVDNVVETAAGIFVHASLHNPDPGTMVSQLVSYPNQVIKITDVNKPIYLIGD